MANKTDLINKVQEVAKENGLDLNKKEVGIAVDAVFDSITQFLANHEKVQLVGFGSFEVRERAARKGRNPQTGEEIEIAATVAPVFKPGKALKEVVK